MSEAKLPLATGLTGAAETVVDESNTAQALGSGSLPVFGTPALLALMEQAACDAVLRALPEGISTVGAEMQLRHLAPTPVNGRVRAEATLTQADGRRLLFACKAYDDSACIGECTQVRYMVDSARFLSKANNQRG